MKGDNILKKTFEMPELELIVLADEKIMDDTVEGEMGWASATTPD